MDQMEVLRDDTVANENIRHEVRNIWDVGDMVAKRPPCLGLHEELEHAGPRHPKQQT